MNSNSSSKSKETWSNGQSKGLGGSPDSWVSFPALWGLVYRTGNFKAWVKPLDLSLLSGMLRQASKPCGAEGKQEGGGVHTTQCRGLGSGAALQPVPWVSEAARSLKRCSFSMGLAMQRRTPCRRKHKHL